MKKLIVPSTFALLLNISGANATEPMHIEAFTGVVTYHLFPAKVLKINQIIDGPQPGTSVIGEEGILFDAEENPNVVANWSVVKIKYFKYHEPKSIKYEILSKQHQITVNHHAVSLEIIGDISEYIEKH